MLKKGAFQHLGDLVISLPVAEKMAKKFGVSRRREVETLVIHGFLHLCGHDHEVDNGEMLSHAGPTGTGTAGCGASGHDRQTGPKTRQQGEEVERWQPRCGHWAGRQRPGPRNEAVKKDKTVERSGRCMKPKEPSLKRAPGRPRKDATAPAPAKRLVRRRSPAPSRSGVIG